MNITGIENFRYTDFIPLDKEGNIDPSQAPIQPQDIVNFSTLPDMSDEEVEDLMNETIQMIGNDYVGAMSVHSGLDPQRVYSLLAMA
ncbi:MAG: hypothetical protein IJU40_03025 [Desulfovibrionaceae bacterium]|nr:hypothetical protein [Desulfovibrionaceae bacterium]